MFRWSVGGWSDDQMIGWLDSRTVGWSVGGWSDSRMVGGRAVRWPVGQVVRWSRVFEWLNGRLIGCRIGHKQ